MFFSIHRQISHGCTWVRPSWIPPPTCLPTLSLWVVSGTDFECLDSCIERHFLFYWLVFIPLSKISWLYFCGLFLEALLFHWHMCLFLLSYCSFIALKSGSLNLLFFLNKFSWLVLFLCLSNYILELDCCGLQKNSAIFY